MKIKFEYEIELSDTEIQVLANRKNFPVALIPEWVQGYLGQVCNERLSFWLRRDLAEVLKEQQEARK